MREELAAALFSCMTEDLDFPPRCDCESCGCDASHAAWLAFFLAAWQTDCEQATWRDFSRGLG